MQNGVKCFAYIEEERTNLFRVFKCIIDVFYDSEKLVISGMLGPEAKLLWNVREECN